MLRTLALLALADVLLSPIGAQAQPPYSGTIFLDPDIITAAEPTEFVSLVAAGQGVRTMYDRRTASFNQVNALLFEATFAGGQIVEVQVNPEFGDPATAEAEALVYLPAIGQLPRSLRRDLETIWIHRGNKAFGGGNNNLLIHTGSFAEGYIRDGILAETFVHEASHTSLDADHAQHPNWLQAQRDDGEFISTYARDNPIREDIAETFLTWYAVRYAADRIPAGMKSTIENTIPNRLAYLDAQTFDLRPLVNGESADHSQFWIVGLGSFSGTTLQVAEAVSTRGGVFGANFDPDAVENVPWGQFEITVIGCAGAILVWNSTQGSKSSNGSYELQRVAPNAQQRDCEARDFVNDFDPNWATGSWFGGPARSGEGLLIDVLDSGDAFAAWFTYRPAPD
ncbi:MAG: hypothetical protein AAGA23_11040 [Pseudomonadota bacterium]